jgi:hypothetical protein
MPTITIASFFFKPKNLASEGSESGPAKQPEDFSVPHNAEKIGSEIQGSQCEISTADSVGPPNKRNEVHGCYHHQVQWVIPDEIDLDDKETYEYCDRWGILYIRNKKTGKTIELANCFEMESDFKRCDELQLVEVSWETRETGNPDEEEDQVSSRTRSKSKLHQ